MPAARLRDKFLDCAACATRPLNPARAVRIVDIVLGLDSAPDIRTLMRLLA
jgi:hypothetical protein